MQVTIRLFAQLRERAGAAALELELPDGALVGDALERLAEVADGLPVVMAVNRSYAGRETALHPGDELALIPPVSGGQEPDDGSGTLAAADDEVAAGGAAMVVHVRVTPEPLRIEPLLERVRDPRAGAVVTFHGVTRAVPSLDYEAYAEMAQEQMAGIVAAAVRRHKLCAAAAEHRVGEVPLSEPSVLVAVSAPHRGEAFAGAREIIDEIKARAPIWKRELTDEGASWVQGRPPRAP